MTEVRFYHLRRTPLEQALPGLLERCLERGWRALVVAGSEERVEALDQHLWTYRPDSFLPHGTVAGGAAAEQPVLLSTTDDAPNGATVLFLCDGAASSRIGAFDLCCDVFDGNDDSAVAAARARWKAYRADGHDVTYWQQGERGWEKKA
ncbi:MAG TPA: DNA polymerase III subunit chi [Alphaproteobacteria bacterium]|nr:DNA polymerase III subunit chi [Alphaproteobacteria bacterium]